MEKPLQVFCCYAREDQLYLFLLKKHLKPLERRGLITVQADIDISPGEEWEKKISHYLNTAQMILLLVSPDFMNSEYSYSKEMMRAMERHEDGEARVIPIILRSILWHEAPFAKLQVLPTNTAPVISQYWQMPDDAFLDVTKGIQKAVEELLSQSLVEALTIQQTRVTLEKALDSTIAISNAAAGQPPSPSEISPPIGTTLVTYREHGNKVYAVAWSPDGTRVVSGGEDTTAQIWNAATGSKLLSFNAHHRPVRAVAWSPDGRWVASSCYAQMYVWDAETAVTRFFYDGHGMDIRGLAWSPESNYVVTACADTTLHVVDGSTGSKRLTYRGHNRVVQAVAWSPDGIRLASAGDDKTVQVWDATTGTTLLTYHDHLHSVYAVTWSPDGTYLASASLDRTVHIWDAKRGNMLRHYDAHNGIVRAVAWSPDGKRVASGSTAVHVWDVETGKLMLSYSELSEIAFALAWSPDGTRIASAGADGVQIWQAV